MWRAIVVQETASVYRSRWASALVVAPFLLLSVLVVVRWPSAGEVDVSGMRARSLFALIGYALLGCVLLIVPAFPATSIVRERRQRTLALLFNTPIRGPEILLAKFLGNLGCVALPLVMSAPIVAACYAMGGIDMAREVFPLYAILVLLSIQLVAMSLWVSCFASAPVAAIRTTYGLVVGLTIVPMGPALLFPAGASGPLAGLADALRCLSPAPPVTAILGHSALTAGRDATLGTTVGVFAVLAVLSAVFFLLHAAIVLKPTTLDRARPTGTITQDRSATAQWQRRLLYLVDPQRRSSATPDWINPVMVKEFRSRRFGRGHWLFRLVALCAVASLAMSYAATTGAVALSPETVGGVMVLLQSALIVMLTPSLASGMISEEREGGGWALLRMTPLTPGQIVRGKLMSVSWTVMLVLLATLPGYAIMVLIKPVLRQQVVAVLLTLLLMAALAMCVSGAVSAFFRRTAPATITAYLILVTLLLGPLVFWLGRDAPFGHQLVERMLALSPVAAALSLIEAPGFTSYYLLPTTWWITGGGTVACVAILCWRIRRLEEPR